MAQVEANSTLKWATRVARGASRMRGDLPLALLDIVLVMASYGLLLGLRFDFAVPADYWASFRAFIPFVCLADVVATLVFGGYGRSWRHASIDEARSLLLAGCTSLVILVAVYGWSDNRVPVSVLVAGSMLATFLMGLVRFQSRLFAFRRSAFQGNGVRVAVVGAGSEAAAALREMSQHPNLGLLPVVAIADDPNLRWRSIHGVPVGGDIGKLPEVLREYRVDQILLAMPDAPTLGRPPRRRWRRCRRCACPRAADLGLLGPRHAPPARHPRARHRGPAAPRAGAASTSSRCASC